MSLTALFLGLSTFGFSDPTEIDRLVLATLPGRIVGNKFLIPQKSKGELTFCLRFYRTQALTPPTSSLHCFSAQQWPHHRPFFRLLFHQFTLLLVLTHYLLVPLLGVMFSCLVHMSPSQEGKTLCSYSDPAASSLSLLLIFLQNP